MHVRVKCTDENHYVLMEKGLWPHLDWRETTGPSGSRRLIMGPPGSQLGALEFVPVYVMYYDSSKFLVDMDKKPYTRATQVMQKEYTKVKLLSDKTGSDNTGNLRKIMLLEINICGRRAVGEETFRKYAPAYTETEDNGAVRLCVDPDRDARDRLSSAYKAFLTAAKNGKIVIGDDILADGSLKEELAHKGVQKRLEKQHEFLAEQLEVIQSQQNVLGKNEKERNKREEDQSRLLKVLKNKEAQNIHLQRHIGPVAAKAELSVFHASWKNWLDVENDKRKSYNSIIINKELIYYLDWRVVRSHTGNVLLHVSPPKLHFPRPPDSVPVYAQYYNSQRKEVHPELYPFSVGGNTKKKLGEILLAKCTRIQLTSQRIMLVEYNLCRDTAVGSTIYRTYTRENLLPK